MRCSLPWLLLVCLAAGCRSSGGGGVGTTGPGDRATQAAPDAAAAPAPEDPLGVFIEAARSGLMRPYQGSEDEIQRQYADSAARLLGPEPALNAKPASLVAMVLSRSDDPRAAPALVDWAGGSSTSTEHLALILEHMRARPRAAYLPAVHAVLANERAAEHLVRRRFGAFSEHLRIPADLSLHGLALLLAAELPGGEGRNLVREIALDRAKGGANPQTLASLTCPPNRRKNEEEAQALANLRILAMAALGDKPLMLRLSADPTEPAILRTWAERMARGPRVPPDPRAAKMAVLDGDGPLSGLPYSLEWSPCW